MNDKLMINPEVFVKIFNLLDFLETNCNNLIDINCSLVSSNNRQHNLINRNIEALAVLQNKITQIREEIADQTRKHIEMLENFKLVNNNDTKLARTLKTLEMLSAEILDETYYINQNGKIIK